MGHLLRESSPAAEQRDFIDALVSRLTHLGVTVLLTFETRTLQPSGMVTDRGVSPIADNLLMLRYRESESGLRPTITVIKTRGSAHDFRTHDVAFGLHGIRVVHEDKRGQAKALPKRKRKRA